MLSTLIAKKICWPVHESAVFTKNATSDGSDESAHIRSLIRDFAAGTHIEEEAINAHAKIANSNPARYFSIYF